MGTLTSRSASFLDILIIIGGFQITTVIPPVPTFLPKEVQSRADGFPQHLNDTEALMLSPPTQQPVM